MKANNRILRFIKKELLIASICSFLVYLGAHFLFFNKPKPINSNYVKIETIKPYFSSVFEVGDNWPSHFNTKNDTLKFHYTFQDELTRKIKSLLKKYKSDYSSIVVIDNKTGGILSAVGFTRKNNSFNLSLPFSSTHPSASLFKIITMASLLEQGNLELESSHTFSGKSNTLYKSQLFKKPHFRWKRTLSLNEAFAKSNNVIFGKAALQYLDKNLVNIMAHKFGFNAELMMELSLGQSFFEVPKDDYNLAEIASGFNKKTMISPIHAAVLSSVIANNGVIKYPFIVSKLTDNKKRELLVKPALLEKRVIKKSTSKLISKAMESTVKKGTARKSFRRFDRFLREELRIGGKTGSITGGIPFGKRDWFSAFAVPKNKKLGEGISISVMNINVDKWFVRSTYLAKEVIDYYYKEINPLKEIITSLNKNKSEEKI
tara:strand:+ start:2421 stop:3713 length:1293 start_codon:yes stop_codon:yes gene_type:complete